MTGKPGAPGGPHAVLIGVSAYQDPEFPEIRAARLSLAGMLAMLTDPALCGWPPSAISVIRDPGSVTDLANQLTDLAEKTTGTLLVYYVGHGTLSERGDLCLTLTTTRRDRPDITGLQWDAVARALRCSPARVRIAILDCCFAGQAISEALAGDAGTAVADITHVEGVYTLTATTRNKTAHVPPMHQQNAAPTSFTGALLEVVTSGIDGAPPGLTLDMIYARLRFLLAARGLPRPNKRGTDTADHYVFSRNAARCQEDPQSRAGTPWPQGPPVASQWARRMSRPRTRRMKLLASAAGIAAAGVLATVITVLLAASAPSAPPAAHASDHRHGSAGTSGTASSRTSPAVSTRSPPVAVCPGTEVSCEAADLQMKPKLIDLSVDGSGQLLNITWAYWGGEPATGTGILEINDCNPSCGGGTFTGYPATVTLSALLPYKGREVYTRMTIAAPTAPAAERNTVYTLSEAQ
jgi:Caspase domain